MAAILTSVKDDKDKKPFYLNACRLMNIEVLPPDVNESEQDFTPSGDAIRYGLSAVRNVGAGAVALILDARNKKGRFESFTDFCRKVEPGVLTKKVLESLSVAGAFGSLGYTRRGMLEGHDKISGPISAERKSEAAGQFSLFGGASEVPHEYDESGLYAEEFDKHNLLRLEKEVLGQFVTDHPLLAVKDALRAAADLELSDVETLGDGDLVTVGGIAASVQRKFTKKGEPFATFRLEDLVGGVQVVAFPDVWDQVSELVASDSVILVKGRVDLRMRELQIRAMDIRALDPAANVPSLNVSVVVEVPAVNCTNGMLVRLKETLAAHPGAAPVHMRLVGETGVTPLKLGDGFRVDPSAGLLSELRLLLGPNAVRLDAA
jgi:DNA polymerase-3 subunit alpha